MGQRQRGVRALAGLVTTVMLTGLGLVLSTQDAVAAPQRGVGHETSPAQPYKGNPDATDWAGSYIVNGRQSFCVQFAFLAPDSDEQYQPGQPLMTKWGTPLSADVAADISYLLLRYGDTKNADQAAALSHLLHSWTAAPQTPDQLLPTNDFRHIAFDAPFHLAKLPPAAQAAVETLRADATANHGPWSRSLTAPTKPQIIGVADNWTVTVTGAAGKGLPSVPVTVTVTDGTLESGKATGVLTTPADGSPLLVPVTPTGANPSVTVELASPADQPVVQQAIQVDTQRIVSTGGEKKLTDTKATTAKSPGQVKVTKINEKTGAAIPGVPLRLTAADKTTPAKGIDGKPLVGTDGKPTVLITGSDGTATVANLDTPQEICVIEVASPSGFEDSFDPNAPPTECGTVDAGATLALSVANKPNVPKVPIKVPAGDRPVAAGYAAVDSISPLWAVLAVGLLVLIGAGLLGLGIRRRMASRR
jgi:hypothetical protein